MAKNIDIDHEFSGSRPPGGIGRSLEKRIGLVLCVLTMAYFVLHGAMGIGRTGGYPSGSLDFICLYASGDVWVNGENPYAMGTLRAQAECREVPEICLDRLYCVLAYPPHCSAILSPLSTLPWDAARILYLLVNLAAAAAIMWVVSRLIRARDSNLHPWLRAVIIPLSVGPFFADTEIHYGQTTLLVLAAFVVFVWSYERESWLLAGIALAVSAIKPNMVFIPCLVLLFRPRWKVVAVAVATGLLMSLPAILLRGGPGVFLEWFDGMKVYKSVSENQATSPRSFGLAVLAAGVGLSLGVWLQVLLAAAASLAFGLLWRSKRLPLVGMLVLVPISLFLGGGHDVDVLTLGPVVALLLALQCRSPVRMALLGGASAICVGWIGVQASWFRIDALFDLDMRVWREVFVLVIVAAFTYEVIRPGERAAEVATR